MLLKHLLYLEDTPGLKKPEVTYFKDVKKIPKSERPSKEDRWKARSVSGTEGDVIEFRKDSTKEKKYEKTYLNFKVNKFLQEAISYTIIEEVNKAWKIFSGLGDMLPIPKSVIFDINATLHDAIFSIHTSGHYKSEGKVRASTLDYDSPKANKLFEYIKYGKSLLINVLIGYADMHHGNIRINKEKNSSFYAIDLAFTFKQSRKHIAEEIYHSAIMKKDKKALQKYLKQLEFFEFYVEHNKKSLVELAKNTAEKYYANFLKVSKEANLSEKQLEIVKQNFKHEAILISDFIKDKGIPDILDLYKRYKPQIEDALK